MGKEKGTERSESRSNGSGVTEEGRSPTGVTPGGGSVISGPLENGQRWTIARKREVAIRVMRGESIEMLSRELGVEGDGDGDQHQRNQSRQQNRTGDDFTQTFHGLVSLASL